MSCVNALSTHFEVEVRRDGKIHHQTYSIGAPTSEIAVTGTCDNTGTKITFLPDASIFTTTEYSYDVLSARLRELAYLNKGIRLSITDRREKDENGNFRGEVFYSVDGLKEFVKYLDANRGTPLTEDIIYIDTEKDGIPVEVAMQYNDSFSENVHSYVRSTPSSTAMIPGLSMTFLIRCFSGASVNRLMPADHIMIRLGMMNRLPRKSPS